ncbi:MAG: phosphatidate cytidylyltransferase [Limnohabitans sp.]|nr:phosphatidate cytidylyltransferase [Limnohabitans sp.]
MLKQRIITALLLLAVFLPALFHPDARWLGLAGLVLVAAGAWEWGRLNGMTPFSALLMPVFSLILCIVLWFSGAAALMPHSVWLLTAVFWVSLLAYFLKNGIESWRILPALFRNLIGTIVLTMTWLALYKAKSEGTAFLTSVLLLVWVADISAYFVGKQWGRHKLAPSISPGKSREGLAGGVLGVLVLSFAWLALQTPFPALNDSLFARLNAHGTWFMLAGILFLALISAAGDLFESLLKRSAGVKDSSRLLPGHGGVLDRLDALLPSLPLAMLLHLI